MWGGKMAVLRWMSVEVMKVRAVGGEGSGEGVVISGVRHRCEGAGLH